jgi:predicted GIY-YIG superfamily endonuclease
VRLLFYEAFPDRADALRRERHLKTTAGKGTLKLMLREYLEGHGA